MSTDSNVVYVPYMGTTWICRCASRILARPLDRIESISIGGVWVDAEVVLDSLFRNRLEAVLNVMPSNSEPNLSWPRSIA